MMATLYNEIICERPNAAAVGAYSIAIGNGATKAEASRVASEAAGSGATPEYDVSVKDVFNNISLLNPTRSEISSMGGFVSNMNQEVSDRFKREILSQLPKNSLAYKILEQNYDSTRNYDLSDKQKWVIAYELQKNKSYTNKLGADMEKRRNIANQKADASKAKKSANKKASQPLLNEIKAKGFKLGDYYKWLNTSGNVFRGEYFSKKYSSASVNDFLKSRRK